MLLDGECDPTTSQIGFVELPVTEAASILAGQYDRIRLRVSHHDGPLRDALYKLLPLTSAERVRMLLIQTASRWTAYFDSGWRGTDSFPIIANLAEHRCMGMKVAADPKFGNIWSVYGPEEIGDPELSVNSIRHISATDEGVGNWEFRQAGKPFPFEDVSYYSKRRIRDRFPIELLVQYLARFDIDLFSADFYRGPAVLLEMQLYRHLSLIPSRLKPHRINEYATFAAARENRPSRPLLYLSHWRSSRDMDNGLQEFIAQMNAHFSPPA
jgi:hypothetical protein